MTFKTKRIDLPLFPQVNEVSGRKDEKKCFNLGDFMWINKDYTLQESSLSNKKGLIRDGRTHKANVIQFRSCKC